ncbi:helix-turn-helix domain-containing protein [Pseudomonas luteola]|nr:helix-turn-helix domain-containing protein [Pseudomonas luteola]
MTDIEKPLAPGEKQSGPVMPIQCTSASAQRKRLVVYMQENGSVDTFTAIRELNVLRPGARIAELRAEGYNIKTHLGRLYDDQGRPHSRCATYYLSAEPISANEEAA